MKLLRCGLLGAEKPAVLTGDGTIRDVSGMVPDYDPVTLASDAFAALKDRDLSDRPVIDPGVRRGSPIARPGTIWCIGLNYADHAREAGMTIPEEPVVFSKAASALSGPEDPIRWREDMRKLDWEVELGVVIGRPAFEVNEADALAAVLGYTIVNDVSERAWQLERGGQWMKGKSYPSFCPVGPWIATADEIPDPQALRLWLEVDGERVQDGTTADMIFPVAQVVSYLSRFARLEPGDLICTGTPAGVGAGFDPPRFLSEGSEVRLGIEGLGEQHQRVAA